MSEYTWTGFESEHLRIRTPRLVMRPFQSYDAAFLLELVNEPDWLTYVGDRGVQSLADAHRFIEERLRESYRVHGYGLYAVEQAPLGIPVGMCGFVRRETLDAADLGYAVLHRHTGQGIATEACHVMLRFAAEALQFDRVLAITNVDHAASQRILDKLGFRSRGTIRLPHESSDTCLFALDLDRP